MAFFSMDYEEIDRLVQMVDEYGDEALRAIDSVLHGEGGKEISEQIQAILPSSGRRWKGKRTAASATNPFQQDNSEMLAVTVKSKTAYNYLYFPDDGSNTRKHAGNQGFMMKGAENATDKIIDLCIGKLTENFRR